MIEISVNQDDIESGVPATCWDCPMARAAARVFNSRTQVEVSPKKMHFFRRLPNGATLSASVGLPSEARAFVDRFDDETPVEPFSFAIEAPAWALKEVVG